MHLSKAQKNDLFLAFKLRNETRGVFAKIARYLGMTQTNLNRMVQNSKEYEKFAEAELISGTLSGSIVTKRISKDISEETKTQSGLGCEDCLVVLNDVSDVDHVSMEDHDDVNAVGNYGFASYSL